MAIKLVIDKNPLVIKVPMEPYLYKFLLKKYGKEHKAAKTNLLGLMCLDLVTHNFTRQKPAKTNCYFVLKIPFGICVDHGHFINYDQIPVFQKKMEKMFKDFIVEFVKINSINQEHGEIIRSIRKFFIYYGISEEEFSLDYAYKLYQRGVEKLV
jgi:hypothetical protein